MMMKADKATKTRVHVALNSNRPKPCFHFRQFSIDVLTADENIRSSTIYGRCSVMSFETAASHLEC